MATHSLPGESHGQRSLVGYSTWGREESDMTERLHLLTYLTEGVVQSYLHFTLALSEGRC